MAVDPTQLSPQPAPPAPQPIQVAAAAAAPTPQQAAQALQDAVSANAGFIGPIETAAATHPGALLSGVGGVLLVLLGVFVYLVVEAVHNANRIAQHYLDNIFTANAVWVIVAGVLIGGAWIAKSPLKNPPAVPGSYTGK